jgi:hypothetical protein
MFFISRQIKFLFVTVIPKYLNFATFSKDLLLVLHSNDETCTYCGIFAQCWNCGAEETAVAREWLCKQDRC